MKKKILFILTFLLFSNLFAQNDSLFQKHPKLYLDFQLINYDFIEYAATTVSKNQSAKTIDYFKAYANPSMSQSAAITANINNLAYFGYSKLNINFFKNDFLNNLTHVTIWASGEIAMMYMPLGRGWLHEEFHRAVLTKHYTNSFDDMNIFPIMAETVSVNNVSDENLIRFKAENNSDFIRLHVAGIEGEYVLIDLLQKQTFFYNQKLKYSI